MYKLMNIFKNIVRKIYMLTLFKPVNLAKGKRLANLHCSDSEYFYIITSHGLGDVVWMCVYLNAYLKKKNLKTEDVVVITERKLSEIIEAFIPGLNYQYVSRKDLINLQRYLSIHNNMNNVKLAVFPLVRMDRVGTIEFNLLSYSGAEMDSLYRIGVFGLDRKSESYPIINNKPATNGRIIFVPFVNSRNAIPISIWNKIVDISKKTKKELFTNVGPNEKPLDGTNALTLGLKELAEDITENDLVVGGRCGLIDWLFITQKNVIVLHSVLENPKNKTEISRNRFAEWESFEYLQDSVMPSEATNYVRDVRLKISENGTDISQVYTKISDFLKV